MIDDEKFEEARRQWRPKIEKFSRRDVPYMDADDVRQEMELVLYRCLKGFKPHKGTTFHTYLHKAMDNRIKKLWGPFVSRGEKNSRGIHPKQQLYLGSFSLDTPGTDRTSRLLVEKLTTHLDPSLEMHMESFGFQGHEQTWLEGRCYGLSIREIAQFNRLPEEAVREGYESAQRKIRRLKRRGKKNDYR